MTFDEQKHALEHPAPEWQFGDIIGFGDSANPAWVEKCIVWMNDTANALQQLHLASRYWMLVPLEATRCRANAVEYYESALHTMGPVTLGHIELAPTDEWLNSKFGADNIDHRVYCYRLFICDGEPESIAPIMYEGAPGVELHLIDVASGRDLTKQAVRRCRQVIEQWTTFVTTCVVAVTTSKVMRQRLKGMARRDCIYELHSDFVLQNTDRLKPAQRALARRVLQPGASVVVMHVQTQLVDNLLRRIRACRRPVGVSAPAVFVGRPDVNLFALMATPPEDVDCNTHWIAMSRCRRPRLYDELITLALIFQPYIGPCELIELALYIPGANLLSQAEIDAVLQNTYRSIRTVRSKADAPSRRTRAKTNNESIPTARALC